MKKTESALRDEPRSPAAVLQPIAEKVRWEPEHRRRLFASLSYLGLMVAVFSPVLVSLTVYAVRTDLHSHIVLIPFVSAWLIHLNRVRLPRIYETSMGWAMMAFAAGGVALVTGWMVAKGGVLQGWGVSQNDHFALMSFSFVCFVWSGGFLFLGCRWMAAAAFPMAFLIFLIPLPDGLVHVLERGSMLASADAADLFFNLAGTPHLRQGDVFQLPNIAIQVAQECSGIRSSWVLFITGILASYLFLRSPWRRITFAVLIIPIGILRNGFRIFVIGLLSIEIGPHMIHSVIHTRGGPLFFALSLIPLFVLLWWMRRGEWKVVSKRGDGRMSGFARKERGELGAGE